MKEKYEEYEVVFAREGRPSLKGRNFKILMGHNGPACSMDCYDKDAVYSPQMYLPEIKNVYKLEE